MQSKQVAIFYEEVTCLYFGLGSGKGLWGLKHHTLSANLLSFMSLKRMASNFFLSLISSIIFCPCGFTHLKFVQRAKFLSASELGSFSLRLGLPGKAQNTLINLGKEFFFFFLILSVSQIFGGAIVTPQHYALFT